MTAGPLPTITGAQRGELALISPTMVRLRGTYESHIASSAAAIDEPLSTISAGGTHHGLVAATLINTRNGERHGIHGEQAPRVRDIRDPMPTVTAQGSQGAVVAAFLARHYGGHENDGSGLLQPLPTITCRDHHSLVCAFLLRYYGQSEEGSPRQPLDTITTKDRFGLVTVRGEEYRIVDIGMRMLTPRELYLAQGFRSDYVIDHGLDEHGGIVPLTKTAQVRMVGNSVSPPVAEALVRANVIEQRGSQAA